jgi:hypothetical protein
MYETYRMLGREHEADLEREARTRALAREAAIGNSVKGDVMNKKARNRLLLRVRLIRSRWPAV